MMFVAHNFRRALGLGLLSCFALLAAPQTSSAAVIFSVGNVITGDTPDGSPPWMTVTFADSGANQVTMTIQNNFAAGSQFISNFFFNVDPAIAAMSITNQSGQAPETIHPYSQGAYGNPAFGNQYDVQFSFETANNPNRFIGGESSVFLLSGVGLDENSFSFTTPSNNGGPQYMAAHLQGISGGGSSWIGSGAPTGTSTATSTSTSTSTATATDTDTTTGILEATATGPTGTGDTTTTTGVQVIPEPFTMALWGGLGGALLFSNRRKKAA